MPRIDTQDGPRFVSMEEYERIEARREAEANENFIDDPEDEIRDIYRELTSTLAGQMSDDRAFEKCADQFGFVPTIRALKKLSKKASDLNADWVHRKSKGAKR